MTAPTPEKAAPIPADVLALAKKYRLQFADEAMALNSWDRHDYILARAIMQDRADRASQAEHIREDERGKCAKVAEQYGAGYQKGMPLYGAADKDAGRGRQEGHRDAGHAIAALLRREAL